MRILLALAIALPLAAQTPAASPSVQTPAPTPAPATTDAKATPPPAPVVEPDISGWVDVGYRWLSGVSGSNDAYRSIVNLGSGPKLFGAEVSWIDPKKRLFDALHVRASGWGGDPYGLFHLDAAKSKLYRLDVDYRSLSYFNNLPSYADPLLTRGIILDEQSVDTRRYIGAYSLEFLPGNWLVPYVAYDRDASEGTGVMAFTAASNEYAVPTRLTDVTNLYRGGVRLDRGRVHATLEEGGTTFGSNQSLYQDSGTLSKGNLNTPVFGQTLDLTGLAAAYGIRGSSVYTKALFSASVASWLDAYGQFLFSQPSSSVNYQENATGNFYLPSQIVFYQSQRYLIAAAAKAPHTTASLGAEIRPFKRVRMTESWLTDRMHNAGDSQSALTIAPVTTGQQKSALLAASLASNYNQAETNVFFDVTSKLMVRGGYRYVWGDASDAVLPQGGELTGIEHAKLHRNTGLAGVVYRPTKKLLLTAEAEVASSGGVYFNTSLYDYQKVRSQARYQATSSLSVALDFTYLRNGNPTPGLQYSFLSQQEQASIYWAPREGKIFSLQGSYGWSSLHSDIQYLVPQTLVPAASIDHETAHTASALFTLNMGHWRAVAPKLTAGGSLFLSGGALPTRYYQPMAKLWLPLSKRVQAFAQWWYYGYGQTLYPSDGFTAHIASVGLRYSR